jgi:hypothetical protein
MSCTRSRLSARWVIRGSKPASEATTRITSSSAVLRELTIQGWSRYRWNTSTAVPRGPGPDGVPRLHGVGPSGRLCSCWLCGPGSSLAGARL